MREDAGGVVWRAYQLVVHAAVFGIQKLVKSFDCLLVLTTRSVWVCLTFHRSVHRFASGLVDPMCVRHLYNP